MQRPTDNLRRDHELAALGLRLLAAVGEHVRAGGSFPSRDAATLLRFLREFVVGTHFRKEGEHLCAAVAMLGDPHAAELVGELLRMQEEVTELVHSLVLFWEPVGPLTEAEREGFADAVTALGARLARMRRLEESELFTICEAEVPADDQLDWLPAFDRLDQRVGERSDWPAQLAALSERWLPSRA